MFEGWQESMIWSCLGHIMGKLYADAMEAPSSAMIRLGDFCFFAGEPREELALYWKNRQERMVGETDPALLAAKNGSGLILVPKDQAWGEMIESCYGGRAKKVSRYAIKKEPGVFDQKKLKDAVAALPKGYVLKMIDEALFWRCKEISWCRDWVSQYETYGLYREYGLGVVAIKDGEPVSGASSYSSYPGGIEIEIDTRKDCRRKGLAYACGAKLILECLEKNWYPSWDAQNLWSVALAQKLGYHLDHEYAAYEVS